MSTTEEATINSDGTTTFENADAPPLNDTAGDEGTDGAGFEETVTEVAKGIDPAFLFLGVVVVIAALYYYFVIRKKKEQDQDDFFANLDGEKFNLKLPGEVDEYYAVKEKCESMGWEPGQTAQNPAQASPAHRALAQALMKRAIADIPIVTHIQKESSGMNKLYSQSMCSVNQWRSYQSAEQLVSTEVEEVRAEADEIEPGWSQVIWRQAMQYHQMLKQKHEQEAKQAEEAAAKRKEIEAKVAEARKLPQTPEEKEAAADKAAQELLKDEERNQESKKAFGSSGGMKKGFLDSKGKKK
jgi:flagellar biosynthesis GTPase FlhF